MQETTHSEYLTIAKIRKVQGRRGEVGAEILTDFPQRFQPGLEVLLSGGKNLETFSIENVWFHKGLAILKFRGFEDISAAETLVGRNIQVPLSARMPVPAGEVYLSDLVGCTVLEEGGILGKVESVERTGGAPLLQVATADGEVLIPFAEEICRAVDVVKKEIHVRLPDGLKELNRKAKGPRTPETTGMGTLEVHDARGGAKRDDRGNARAPED